MRIRRVENQPSVKNYKRNAEIWSLRFQETARMYDVNFPPDALKAVRKFSEINERCNDFLDSFPNAKDRVIVANAALQFLKSDKVSPLEFSNHFDADLDEAVALSLLDLRQMVNALSSERQGIFFDHLDTYIKASLGFQNATRFRRAVELRKDEGTAEVDLFLDLLPDEVSNSGNFDKFRSHLYRMHIYMNVRDAFDDFGEDQVKGKSSLPRRLTKLRWGMATAMTILPLGLTGLSANFRQAASRREPR